MIVNSTGNRWPVVSVHAPNDIALQKDSTVPFYSERRNELINRENAVPLKQLYFQGKGAFIDIYV